MKHLIPIGLLLESSDEVSWRLWDTIDLVEAQPERWSREARVQNSGDDDYTDEITTRLEVWVPDLDARGQRLLELGLLSLPEPEEEWGSRVDPSWSSEPIQIKLVFEDQEGGYGGYGPGGGGHEVIVWAGVGSLDRASVLRLMDHMLDNEDYFDY